MQSSPSPQSDQPRTPPAEPPSTARSEPPAALTAPATRPAGPLVIALAVGLVLGGGGVGAAWALSGGGEEPGARADAVAACAALDGFDESKYMTKGPAGEVASHRWGAAYSLSRAAAAGDAAYKPLATTLQEATDRIMMTFKVDAEVKAGIGKARDLCADL